MPRGTELPQPPDGPPRFENGVVPEAAAKPRGFLIFGLVAFIVVSLVLLFYVGNFIEAALFGALGVTSLLLASILGAVIQAILTE